MRKIPGALVLLSALAGGSCAGPNQEGMAAGAVVGAAAGGFDGAIEGAVVGGAMDALETTPAERYGYGYGYPGNQREQMAKGAAAGALIGTAAEGFDGAVGGAIVGGALGGL